MIRKPVLLVVDDEPGMLSALERFAAPLGFFVITDCGGRNAMDRIRETSPDVAPVDLRMPDIGGLEVLRAIRLRAARRPPHSDDRLCRSGLRDRSGHDRRDVSRRTLSRMLSQHHLPLKPRDIAATESGTQPSATTTVTLELAPELWRRRHNSRPRTRRS